MSLVDPPAPPNFDASTLRRNRFRAAHESKVVATLAPRQKIPATRTRHSSRRAPWPVIARAGSRRARLPLPIRALAQVLRGRHLAPLWRAFAAGQLRFAGSTAARSPNAFTAWLAVFRRQPWVVYAKQPFAGPAQVLDYLGRYGGARGHPPLPAPRCPRPLRAHPTSGCSPIALARPNSPGAASSSLCSPRRHPRRRNRSRH
jgi:hypothetical protein